MKKTIYLLGIIFLFSFVACEKETTTPNGTPFGEEEPTAQFVEFNLFYSGTAKTELGREHQFHFTIYHEGSQYSNFTKSANPGMLSGGWKIKTPSKLEAGTYELGGYWDWDESGFENSNEQIIVQKSFEVEGFETESFDINVVDRTSPSDLGWFSGNVKYVGSVSGQHHLRMVIQDSYGAVVSDERCFNSLRNLFGITSEYVSAHVHEGDYPNITLYWDVNDDGEINFSDPHCPLMSDHHISPGLETFQDEVTMRDSD